MKLRRFLIIAAIVLLAACFAQTSIFAKGEWLKVESKNFQLYGNAGEKEIRGAAMKLEQFREAFRQIFPRIKSDSAIRTSVVVFKNDESFKNYKPVDENGKRADSVAGYFQSGADANYIALSITVESADAYRTIFHGYIHFLVNNELGRSNVPAWLNEGIAEYYEQLTIDNDRKAAVGSPDQNNLLLLQQNKLIPFETFFNIDNYSLQKQGSDGAGLYSAQSWALTHFLIQSDNGARNSQLAKFLNSLLAGRQPKEAFLEAFQTDYATMEKELKKYVEQRAFKAQLVNIENKLLLNADMKIASLSEADAKATLGDLLFHLNRVNDAETHFKEALTLDADSISANAALGLIEAERKNFAEAKKYLEKAVGLDDKNYLTHYRYAYALSREGMTDFGFVSNYNLEQATKMREALDKSIGLNPNFPESYNLYAFIAYVRNEQIDEAAAYLDKAIAIAPGNQWYRLRVAELCLREEDFPNARRIAQKVYETAPDERLRVYAKSTINQINSYEAQLESIKNHQPKATNVTDKPLTEEEIARLNEQALIEGINQSLRRPKAGETRVLGYLTKIECVNNVEYSVRIDDQTLKLRSENFDALFLMSYSAEKIGGQVGCGTIKTDVSSVITYRPQLDAKTKTAGEMIAIEIVPKNFKRLN